MNFNLGEMIATGKYTFIVFLLQSLFLLFIISMYNKRKSKHFLYLLLSMLFYSISIAMFFHHFNSIETFKQTARMVGKVQIEGLQQGIEWQQIFYNYEVIVGTLSFIFVTYLYFKKNIR